LSPAPIPTAARWLGLAGLLPFAAAALAALAPKAPLHALALPALLAYGAVILSFLGGIRWGLAMAAGAEALSARLALSVLPSLLAWLALLLAPRAGLLLLALGFAAMLLLDQRIGYAPPWYPRLRLPLSLGALAALLLGVVA